MLGICKAICGLSDCEDCMQLFRHCCLGIGEAFARRFHRMGKKVIITGRRQDRLDEIKKSLPELQTYRMDNTELAALPGDVDLIFSKYPDIDTVWVNGGIQKFTSIKDLSTSSDEDVQLEVTTNVTAPYIIGRHVIPNVVGT